jgi:hypothetical protein
MFHRLAMRSFVVVLMTWIAAHSAPADSAEPDRELVPRIRPILERTIPILPWEQTSTSPLGGSRMGGSDDRTYVISPDGTQLFTQDAGNWQLEYWDIGTGKSLGKFGNTSDGVALAFSPDGNYLVTAAHPYHEFSSVVLYDAKRHVQIRSLDEGVNFIRFLAAAFSPDNKTVALASGVGRYSQSNPTIHLWDVETGEEVRRIAGPPKPTGNNWQIVNFDCLAFSHDGRSLAFVSDRKVLVWEVATGKQRVLLDVLPPVTQAPGFLPKSASAIAFSPDDRLIATAGANGMVRLWDIIEKQELLPLIAHQGGVHTVWFAADGKTLWSFGADNKLLTWPIEEIRRSWSKREKLSPSELAELWSDLGGKDRDAAYAAMRTFATVPSDTLPFLREKVKPAPPIDSLRLKQLIAEVLHEDFNTRRRAIVELRKFGEMAIPALQQAGQDRGRRMMETSDIVNKVIEQLRLQSSSAEEIQALNALTVLRRIGTPEARQLLDELAKGASEATLSQRAKITSELVQQNFSLVAEEAPLESLWTDLADQDAQRAFQALQVLVRRPKESAEFLGKQLQVVAAMDRQEDSPERIAQLITDLDADEFALREKATNDLSLLGRRAHSAMRQALLQSPSAESRLRIDRLLKSDAAPVPSAERLQAERAVEALERAGTEEARQTLREFSQRKQNRWFHEAVTESLKRLEKISL